MKKITVRARQVLSAFLALALVAGSPTVVLAQESPADSDAALTAVQEKSSPDKAASATDEERAEVASDAASVKNEEPAGASVEVAADSSSEPAAVAKAAEAAGASTENGFVPAEGADAVTSTTATASDSEAPDAANQDAEEREAPESADDGTTAAVEASDANVPAATTVPTAAAASAKLPAKVLSVKAARQNVSVSLQLVSPTGDTTVYQNAISLNVRLVDADGNPVEGQTVKAKATSAGYSRYSADALTSADGTATLEIRNLDVGAWSVNVYHDADVSADGAIVYGAADVYADISVRPASEDPANASVSAADAPTKVSILALEQDGADGNKVKVTLQATDDNGKVPASVTDYKYALYTNASKSYGWINDADGTVTVTRNINSSATGTANVVYAQLWDENNKVLAESEHITITAVKPTFNKTTPAITAEDSIEGQATGRITVEGDFAKLAYYKYPNGVTQLVEGNVISGLEAGTYYVFSPAYRVDDTFYVVSSKNTVTVDERALQRYSVTLATDGHAYWWEGNSKYTLSKTVEAVEGDTLEYTVRANDDFVSGWINSAVVAEPAENATISLEKTSPTEWSVRVANIVGDVTLRATGEEKPQVKYAVTTDGDENAQWSKTSVSLSPDGETGIAYGTILYVKPVNAETHYISGVTAEPADAADITFDAATGEVAVRDVNGDVALRATSVEKPVASALEVVGVHFNENAAYSEENPSVQVSYSVKVTDQFGEAVPRQTLYFKASGGDVSYAQARTSDDAGIAVFTYSYGIGTEGGSTTADYTALFALDSAFVQVRTSEDIHLVLQRKANLVLYEDQIIGTKPGQNDGRVIGVPDGYEIWTGEVHQGALVVGSGEWVAAVNGEFTGLSAGQHILRAGERADTGANTFYFASDYADFFVPRGLWDVKVDAEASEHVVFTGNVSQVAEPGGTVYFYVQPEEGFEITSFEVDRPGYVSEGVSYREEGGYVVIAGISGNLVLTVKAEAVEEEPVDAADDSPSDGPAAEVRDEGASGSGEQASSAGAANAASAGISDAVSAGYVTTGAPASVAGDEADVSASLDASRVEKASSNASGSALSARGAGTASPAASQAAESSSPVTASLADVPESALQDAGDDSPSAKSPSRAKVSSTTGASEIADDDTPLAQGVQDVPAAQPALLFPFLLILLLLAVYLYYRSRRRDDRD